MTYRIPFNKPFMVGKELYYIAQAVLSGQASGDGQYSKKCQKLLEQRFDAKQAFLTTSCTTALEMAAILCNLNEGDEVILPSFTFSSTANAFLLHGGRPVFVDIRPDTLNMDETLVEAAVTERTKVIAPMHYAGVGCEMDTIVKVAKKCELIVVEDAAQGVNARYKGAYLGTIGEFGAYSFHETKNFSCGEGGALLTNAPRFVERAEIIREKGTNRSRFFRGEVDKYTWVDIGSSYLPSDILAAFLYAQLENMDLITTRRKAIYEDYLNGLRPLAERGVLTLPTIPDTCVSNYHMFYVLLQDQSSRMALIRHLKDRGILAVFHYVPLHTSPMGEQLGYKAGSLPVTEDLSERLLRLPFYYDLHEEDIATVIQEICAFFRV